MKVILLGALLELSLSVSATTHSICYNYFLKKDGCVPASASAKTRCKVPPKHVSQVHTLTRGSDETQVKVSLSEKRSYTTRPLMDMARQSNAQPSLLRKRDDTTQPIMDIVRDAQPDVSLLQKRYDTTEPIFNIAGPTTETGTGICGHYNSTTDLGVCLWSGPGSTATLSNAGWLNGEKTSNCGKRVYVQLKGRPETVQSAKVIDGCGFEDKKEDEGCFQIALTIALAKKLGATAEELSKGVSWDFDNLTGDSTQQGPV